VFSGKKVFITGGSSGIGKQLAADFLRAGAHVTIAADQPEKLEAARRELASFSPSIVSYVCDVGELTQVRSVAAAYLEKFGAPDILISNAGFAVYRTFEQMSSEEIVRLLSVNFLGACMVTREFLPAMIKSGRGNIVLMASIAGRIVMTPCGVYCAAKHGLAAWAHTLKLELSHTDVHVHVIFPGRVETNFFDHESFVTRAPRKETRHVIPIEDVSHAVFKSIETNRFMTYIPRFYQLLDWFTRAFPFPVETLLESLIRSRLTSHRLEKRGNAG